MISLILLLLVIIAVCIYVIRNLVKKVEVLEDNNQELVDDLVSYSDFFETLQTEANNAYARMQQIDRLGSFEADDETGIVFKEIFEIVQSLNERFE